MQAFPRARQQGAAPLSLDQRLRLPLEVFATTQMAQAPSDCSRVGRRDV